MRYFQAGNHPSTTLARPGLTWWIEREPIFSLFFFLFLKGSNVSLVRHRYYKLCIMAIYDKTISFIFVDYNIATKI